jgi:hypothetical protein
MAPIATSSAPAAKAKFSTQQIADLESEYSAWVWSCDELDRWIELT